MSTPIIRISDKNISKEELQKAMEGYKKCADYCKAKLEAVDAYRDYVKRKVDLYESMATEGNDEVVFPVPGPSESIMDFTQFTAKNLRIKMHKMQRKKINFKLFLKKFHVRLLYYRHVYFFKENFIKNFGSPTLRFYGSGIGLAFNIRLKKYFS